MFYLLFNQNRYQSMKSVSVNPRICLCFLSSFLHWFWGKSMIHWKSLHDTLIQAPERYRDIGPGGWTQGITNSFPDPFQRTTKSKSKNGSEKAWRNESISASKPSSFICILFFETYGWFARQSLKEIKTNIPEPLHSSFLLFSSIGSGIMSLLSCLESISISEELPMKSIIHINLLDFICSSRE